MFGNIIMILDLDEICFILLPCQTKLGIAFYVRNHNFISLGIYSKVVCFRACGCTCFALCLVFFRVIVNEVVFYLKPGLYCHYFKESRETNLFNGLSNRLG